MIAIETEGTQKKNGGILEAGWRRLAVIQTQLRPYALSPFTLGQNLRGYSMSNARADVRAGINVALLAFPQGMAYAMIAGLPIQFGIFCAAIAALTGPLLASSKIVALGPSNATSVMLLSVFLTLPPEIDRLGSLPLLVCMVGVFLIIGAFLQLASLIKFISRSVIIGYITGAALLIMVNQLHRVLGTSLAEASTLLDVFWKTMMSLPQVNFAAVILAALTFATLWALGRWMPVLPGVAATLVLMALVAQLIVWLGFPLALLQPLPLGEWPVTVPSLNFTWFQLLVGPAVAIAFLATLETNVMAKTFASRSGQVTNSNQEMLSLGVANIASGFSSGMIASASMTRSALNWRTGATSPMASIINGALVTAGALTLGPFVGYIPVPALAAVVISVAITLIDPRQIRISLKSTKSDAAVLIITFTAAMLTPLHFAIFVGVASSIALFLKKASSPQLVEYSFNEEGNLAEAEQTTKRDNPFISIIHVEGELFFGAADLFREEIRRVCTDRNLKVVVLRLRNARHLDATSVIALEELILFLRSNGRHLIVSGAGKEVYKVLRNSGLLDVLDRENLFMGSPTNPNLSTRKALKRAQELIGPEKPEVRIFYDPAQQAKKASE